jgi:uncharacterized membrane protein
MGDPKTLEYTIEVDAPADTVYNQWTQFEEFPRFMEGVRSVRQIDDKRVHWIAEVAGKVKEWDAEITKQIPNREIDWVGLGDPDNRGRILFEPENGCTRVTLMLDYETEGALEAIGDAIGIVKGRVMGDMERFKEFIEGRGVETGGWRGQIEGDEVIAEE